MNRYEPSAHKNGYKFETNSTVGIRFLFLETSVLRLQKPIKTVFAKRLRMLGRSISLKNAENEHRQHYSKIGIYA